MPVSFRSREFVEYHRSFQQHAVPEVDGRLVVRLERTLAGLPPRVRRCHEVDARRVVVGAGIGFFAWMP